MKINLVALLISCLIGLPLGASLAILRFKFRNFLIAIINALMALPPVVVGLLVYLYLARSGPFGWLGLLYTPTAMIIAQIVLVTPIIAALSCQIIEDLHEDYKQYFFSIVLPPHRAVKAYLYDARYSLITAVLAGFGRAISEVGAVIIVGGNIDHVTRVMTTAISLETSNGNLPLALALGFVLLVIALSVNFMATLIKTSARKKSYV